MNIVKFLVVRESKTDFTVICEDGGVCGGYYNVDEITVDLYHDRVNQKTNIKHMFDILYNGKIEKKEYKFVDVVTPTIVLDCINWLFRSSVEYLKTIEYVDLIDKDIDCLDVIKEWIKVNYKKH